jgi:trigger factor
MLENSKQRLASQRLSLEMMGLTDDGYKVQFRDVAREQVKGSLLLDAVANKESIEVTDQEIAEQVALIAQSTKQDPAKVAHLYQTNHRAKDSLVAQMREDKATRFLVERAKVTEVPKSEIKN